MGGLWFSTKPQKNTDPSVDWKVIWINCSLFRTFCCWFEVSYSFYRCRTTMTGQEEKPKFHLTRNRGNRAAKSPLIRHQWHQWHQWHQRVDKTPKMDFLSRKWITKRSASVDIDNSNWSPLLTEFDILSCRIFGSINQVSKSDAKGSYPPLPHLYLGSSPVPVQRANEKHGKCSVAPCMEARSLWSPKVIWFIQTNSLSFCLVVLLRQ